MGIPEYVVLCCVELVDAGGAEGADRRAVRQAVGHTVMKFYALSL
jgi:hypothetical protein